MIPKRKRLNGTREARPLHTADYGKQHVMILQSPKRHAAYRLLSTPLSETVESVVRNCCSGDSASPFITNIIAPHKLSCALKLRAPQLKGSGEAVYLLKIVPLS